MPRAWILQANPKKWDIYSWWEHETEDLDGWTITNHHDKVARGDNFALWIGGKHAGVYAIGKLDSDANGPYMHAGGGYWVDPPTHPVYDVDLDTKRYLFDSPILKQDLASDPDFANALILRMPGGANPFPLEPQEWRAITRRVGRRGTTQRAVANQPIVTARPLGDVPEDITIPSTAQSQRRTYREAQLVKRYATSLGRTLMARAVRLPSGERLVCDAFDDQANLLIEAKASASRQDVRMAIGQLFDYRRHLAPGAALAVLLPERPTDDVLALLHGLKIQAIVETKRGRFLTL